MSVWLDDDNGDRLGIGGVDMVTKEETLIFKSSDRKWIGERRGSSDMMWNHDGTALYHTGGNILCFPTDEYKEIRIKKGCQSRYYEDITISPDNKKMVVERVNVRRPKPFRDILEERHQLYIMDIDGCHECPLFDDE